MSLASALSLTPRPFFCSASQSITSNASTTPLAVTFTPTIAGGVITQSGLQQISIAEYNALQIQNFAIKGINNGNPLLYELVSFAGGSSTTPKTLTYDVTSIAGTAVTTTAFITFNV